jgi:hypothetical protein
LPALVLGLYELPAAYRDGWKAAAFCLLRLSHPFCSKELVIALPDKPNYLAYRPPASFLCTQHTLTVFVRRKRLGLSTDGIDPLWLIVIVLAYYGLEGIIYVKKDSSVRVAPQFRLGRVILLPVSNHRGGGAASISHRCLMSKNARSWLCKSLVYYDSTTALVHPAGKTLWM